MQVEKVRGMSAKKCLTLMLAFYSSTDCEVKVPAKIIKISEKSEAAGERGQGLCLKWCSGDKMALSTNECLLNLKLQSTEHKNILLSKLPY